MTHIPQQVRETSLSKKISLHLPRIHQGKVRDTYDLGDDKLLVVATDRISIFDFVLPAIVTGKGAILTAMTIFWLSKVLSDVRNHLVAFGREIDQWLPEKLRNQLDLQRIGIVVQRQQMVPVECIARGYLTGSGWASYQSDNSVCGIILPPGLHDGSQLPEPIFTPTTKAVVGHDENLNTAAVNEAYGQNLCNTTIAVYSRLAAFAQEREVIMADTKFEFGEVDGQLVLADEVGTPDSSRFWDMTEWQTAAAIHKSPSPHDKQAIRNWGLEIPNPFGGTKPGISGLEPTNEKHLAFIESLEVDDDVLLKTSGLYYGIFKRIIGMSLGEFQRKVIRLPIVI